MNNIIYALIPILFSITTQAQKQDYNWLVGYDSSIPQDLDYGVSNIHFHSGQAEVDYVGESPMDMENYSVTMSDKDGNLQFYTNGCFILNAKHQLIENGDSLNPGNAYDEWCGSSSLPAYRGMQGAFALPAPDNDNLYCLFHLGVIKVSSPLLLYMDKLYYTQINMSANNGLGKVADKNHLLIEDTLCFGQLTAVRHGNGRDWWIIMPESSSDRYYKFLLDPQGVSGPYIQAIGKKWKFKDWSGQAQFTPDGSRYLRFDTYNHLNIFDFDRCSGELSNHRYVDVGFDSDTVAAGGLAISPNSRYAYVSTDYQVWQFDLQAQDIQTSRVQVAYIDWVLAPPGLYTTFYAAQLAPDGKIYINCSAAVAYMHVIHHPDEAGAACDLEQRGLHLAGYNAFSLPNFPNFRLYDLPGSLCDTLGVNAPAETVETADKPGVSVWPNPASDFVEFRLAEEGAYLLQVYDSSGRLLRSERVEGNAFTLRTGDFASGLYFYRVSGVLGPAFFGRFLVVR